MNKLRFNEINKSYSGIENVRSTLSIKAIDSSIMGRANPQVKCVFGPSDLGTGNSQLCTATQIMALRHHILHELMEC